MAELTFEDSIRHTLKEYAQQEGLVFADVAKRAGQSRSSLSTFLNQRGSSITLSTVTKIADAMGLEPTISFRVKE